jgi:cysteine synthase
MSESFSVERRKLMRFFGAKVVLTNPAHKATGMVIKAKELADKHGYFWTNQFENEANAWIHEQTTGPEIVRAFQSEHLHHFVTAYGTGGNLLGIGRYLRDHSPNTQIHVCEPSNVPMLYSGIDSVYDDGGYDGRGSHNDSSPIPREAHPVWRPHLFQGWAADFIPKLVQAARREIPHLNILPTSGYDAMETCRILARNEGIFSGTSGGGIVHSALALAKTCQPGTNILAMVPDTAERYLSTPLFADIPADMTDEERELAASTPSRPPPSPGLPPTTPEAVAFVQEQVNKYKVVVWSLEYCEFCWTLTRFLDRLAVPHERIDIDSFEFAKDQMGNKYRAALVEETKCPTFPQFFLNGRFVGGAVDAAMMWKRGELQLLLELQQ